MKIKGLRWYIAIMLMIVTTINYIDRSALAVAAPTFMKEFNLDANDYANIIICFQLCYLIMQPISGRFLDWLNLRKGLTIAVVWWTIAKMLHALARSTVSFGAVRALLGVGEAANFPAVAKTNAEWFPPRERSMATGLANIGSGTGALLAIPLVSWIILKWNWQMAFVATGILGFAWAALWWLLYRPPEKHPWITQQELDHIQKGAAELVVEDAPHEKGVWKIVLRQKNFWAMGFARFLSEPAWQFFTNFIPLFLLTERGMNLKELAIFGWLPFLAGDLGSVAGGLFSPMYQKIFRCSVLTARKAAMTTSALMMPCVLFIIMAPPAGWASFINGIGTLFHFDIAPEWIGYTWVLIWFSVGAFGHQCISATLLTLPADLFPKRTVATANGLTGSMSHLGGMIFTKITGLLLAAKVGYTPLFVTLGFFDIIGATLLWTMLRKPPVQEKAALREIIES
jgi:MFS transporter, ACS family, hexuronate transporter